MKKKILVTGGCGYIGSHTIVDLIKTGYDVVSVDNLMNGSEEILTGVEKICGRKIKNFKVDLSDVHQAAVFFEENHDFKGVIHFAALKSVADSVANPLLYYRNNINSLLNVLEGIYQYNIRNLIFSSSCSVYGNSKYLPVTEKTPFGEALSPYAYTKQVGEVMIHDFMKIHHRHSAAILRYFNPAGAHESGLIGESTINVATNLVPVITETAIGKREKMTIFGTDYNTRDGSCVRDYIHVVDLARAHTMALKKLEEEDKRNSCEIYNLGIGEGVTVIEAIKAFEKVSNCSLNYELGERRPGDVEAVYSNYEKAKRILGWYPLHNIEAIMSTAWTWEKNRSLLE